MDEPYDRLAALPRELWLPALVTACGESALRLDHVRGWLAALVDGRLPDAALDFGDADALAPMRQAVGELALPALARGVPALAEERPAVLVVHEWWGLNDYARKRAEKLAALGYVAFACDMYGDGKVTTHPQGSTGCRMRKACWCSARAATSAPWTCCWRAPATGRRA